MLKRVLTGGLLGGFVLIVWTFISYGILPIRNDQALKRIYDEYPVYTALRERISEPGIYLCLYDPSPHLPPGSENAEEPLYYISYSGMGHETGLGMFLLTISLFLISPMIAAGLLSVSSERILSRYSRRVLFVSAIGLLFALFGDLMGYCMENSPPGYALYSAFHSLTGWTLAGTVIAWRIRPDLPTSE